MGADPVQARGDRGQPALQPQPAGVQRRAAVVGQGAAHRGAVAPDRLGLIVLAVVLAGYAAIAVAAFLVKGRNFVFPDTSLIFNMATTFAVLVVYLSLAWAVNGRTYGAHVMGLRVVSDSGARLRPLRAVIRGAFCAVFPIGLFWAAVSRRNQSLQDLVLRTAVVYDWQPRKTRA